MMIDELIKYVDEHMNDPWIDPWEKPDGYYGYIYKTTNLINGKIYIGQHVANKFEYINYLGSGKVLKQAIRKYGYENFDIELINWYENQDELNKAEIYWINYYNSTNRDIGYNRSSGGEFGSVTINMTNEEYNSYCKMMSRTHKGMKRNSCSEMTKQRIRISLLGHKVSEETRNRMSESRKGHIHSEETKLKIRESHIGITYSEDTRKKLSDIAKNRISKKVCKNCGSEFIQVGGGNRRYCDNCRSKD